MRWQGPKPASNEEQIANAPDDLFELAPASTAPATTTEANWNAVLPGQDVPLIWEDTYDDDEEDQ